MLKGFKEFIARGNVIDLAVAVVIGAAFTGIVTALVDGLINPLIGVVLQLGDLSTWVWEVPTLNDHVTSKFLFGAILVAAIKFLIVALVVYLVFVLPMNVWRKRQAEREAAGKTDEPPVLTEQELLIQIRDLLAKQQG